MAVYQNALTPEDIPSLFIHYWNQRDAKGIAEQFTEDADFVNVVGLRWEKKTDIEKAHDYGLKVIFPDSDLQLIKSKVNFLSQEIAVVHAKIELVNQTGIDQVKNPGKRQTIFTFVTKKFDNNWKCVAAQNTDIVRGAETNIIDEKGIFKSVSYRKK